MANVDHVSRPVKPKFAEPLHGQRPIGEIKTLSRNTRASERTRTGIDESTPKRAQLSKLELLHFPIAHDDDERDVKEGSS